MGSVHIRMLQLRQVDLAAGWGRSVSAAQQHQVAMATCDDWTRESLPKVLDSYEARCSEKDSCLMVHWLQQRFTERDVGSSLIYGTSKPRVKPT